MYDGPPDTSAKVLVPTAPWCEPEMVFISWLWRSTTVDSALSLGPLANQEGDNV